MKHLFSTLGTALGIAATGVSADSLVSYTVDESFDDLAFLVESAILDQGLVIDSVSHVGEMLERTGADLGAEVKLFEYAEVYSFCSASVSREVMEADILNIAFCPYGIFVYSVPDMPEQSVVGYRIMPGETMAPVNALLEEIVQAAIAE